MSRTIIAALAGTALLAAASRLLAQEVKYEKYELPNGMTVILHQDHSLPVATINLWYYVGSKDEVPGRSGFAHLFEHLMFMGTKRVPGGAFDQIMEAGGGWNNATTSEDRTNYFSYGPANALETLLWLDADRLQDLGRHMNQEKLDKQRDVVRNERRQTYENRPYGQAELQIQELMFPPGHPYHIPVIGTHQDLTAATVADVMDFFAKYYVPCNASLVVAGDFDLAKIKPVIAQLFGTLPRGSQPVHRQARPVRLERVIRNTMSDDVQFAKTYIVYHSPAAYQPGDAEMDLIAATLAQGISSRLYQKLVYQNSLASEVQATQESMLLGSLFRIEATAKPGVELDRIEQAIDEVLAEYRDTGPTPEELERHKARIEYSAVNRLQSITAKADALNAYQFHFGEPNSFQRDLERYRVATAAGVKTWAQKVFTPEARLILRVLPELKPVTPDARDAQPTIGSQPPFTPPTPEAFKLSNGIPVHLFRRHELPLVELRAIFDSGSVRDSADQAGLAALTAEMLDEGAGSRNAVEFAQTVDQLGATLSFKTQREYTLGSLSVLRRNFEPALGLFGDAARRPRFDPAEWKRVQALRVEALRRELDDPSTVAGPVGMRTFFGSAHPYGRPVQGTPESVARLTLEQAQQSHRRGYTPGSTRLLLAGDLSVDDARSCLERAWGDWATDAEPPQSVALPKHEPGRFRVVLVDKPESVQTVVRFFLPGPVYSTPDRVKLTMLNTVFGGSFTSRLNQNLREEHGYTYGAGSRYLLEPQIGFFLAYSNVQAAVTGAAVQEFLKEFAAIRRGDLSAEEVEKARANFRTDLVQDYENLGSMLQSAVTLLRNGRPFDQPGADLKASESVGQGDLNALANAAVPLEQGVLVLVGDRQAILDQIKDLDLPQPVELTVTGEPK
jgi:predicted Zn-dependent peptidase